MAYLCTKSFPVIWALVVFCGLMEISIASEIIKVNASGVSISRKHVTVWFDYSVRYYDHEADNAYSKDDLSAMVNVVSRRFSKIAIDVAPILDTLPPGNDAHSRLWIPEVVATHNTLNLTTPPMEVIVTFDVAKIARTKQLTSFDVAKYMADAANHIYPNTVKTLMMYPGFSMFSSYYNVKDTVQQLKVAREKIQGNSTSPTYNYNLAVFLDLKDCGHFKGSLGSKAKEFLPHVEIIVILLRPNYHQISFTPDILHKMFVTKFEDCERKLKGEKRSIRVIPSVLWMARKESLLGLAQCWQMMSEWGKKNDKEVIMYEAFDTPHGHLLWDQGWWRLKDRAEHEIREESFIEKIQEKGSKGGGGDTSGGNLFTLWDYSDETGESVNSPHNGFVGGASSKRPLTAAVESANNSNALYIVLVLLSVICTLMGAVIVGLVYGFRSMVIMSGGSGQNNYSVLRGGGDPMATRRLLSSNRSNGHSTQQSSFQGEEEEDERGSFNGSVLEIRDTTPIVAVTYKK